MKKSRFRANIVIICMLIALSGVAIGDVATKSVQADNRVIYSGDTTQNNISFMVNVYQGNEYILDMLDVFDYYNVKTTFFIGGSWAVNNLDLVREIYTRGHELGNHGFHHRDQDKLDYDGNYQEINMCHQVISENLGIEMKLFAPPSGAFSSKTVDAATDLEYKTIMWTRDTIDWRDQDSELIYKRAVKDMSSGDLVLMHPTEKTAEALAKILSTAINNGYNPTTVSKCLI
ncbi:MAG: polysaccharide deacetylase family protein [Clostridia bacterium]|nr:polysaccharide deacetylase family protein [Clostridia bacterium]